MKGKNQFTRAEENEIRALLRQMGTVNKADQKKARAGLRRLQFYITDFTDSVEGFGEADFDKLIRSAQVQIKTEAD